MLAKLLEQLRDELPSLMRQYSPSDNQSDYECAFCHNRADTNQGDVAHADDCLGVQLSAELSKLDDMPVAFLTNC